MARRHPILETHGRWIGRGERCAKPIYRSSQRPEQIAVAAAGPSRIGIRVAMTGAAEVTARIHRRRSRRRQGDRGAGEAGYGLVACANG